MKLTKTKKTTIITASLVALFVALFFVWLFVIKPLTEEEENEPVVVTPLEGESTYYGNLSLYPSIDVKDLISITVTNEHGTFDFISRLNPVTVTRQIRLKDYPTVGLSDEVLTYLRVPTLMAMCTSNTPLRDLTPEQMEVYGVTPERCKASWTIKYYSGTQEHSQTVYVGEKSPNSISSYFVAVEGRPHVYEIGSSLENALFIEKEGFVNPAINSVYNETEAIYNVKQIQIGHSNADRPFIRVDTSKQEFEDSLVIKHTVVFPVIARGVIADTTYVSNVLTKTLVNFSGDKVVAINPTDEQKKQYGVGKDDVLKLFYIETFGANESTNILDLGIALSQLKTDEDGNSYYYMLSSSQEDSSVPIIIRIPSIGYEFLEEKNAIKWVATNSVDAGFRKYIYGNEQIGESGVESVEIMTNTTALRGFHDKFILTTTPHPTKEDKVVLSVVSESGLYTFTDNLDAEAGNRNQFNNFYSVMVNYPMPNRFNTMSEQERASVKENGELILSLRVKMKDGTNLGYDYYKIDSANVMCEFFDENNPTPRVVFDTTTEHVNLLATALKQLINGEQVERK